MPLWTAFGLDMNDYLFSKIPKACAKLRPAPPPPRDVSWSLNKVLHFASNIDNNTADPHLLIRKTLFLLAMASGGRVSELAALTRDPGSVVFEENGDVTLYPDPVFLAKNEDPAKRWNPWTIHPLPQDLSLCPVKTLQDFLASASRWSSGQLFRRQTGAFLSSKNISSLILYFI